MYGQGFMPMYGQGFIPMYGQGNVPVYPLGYPGSGPQQPITLRPDQPIYSSYTGKQVGIGGMPHGVICDAPLGNPKYGKPYHVIEVDRHGDAMIHGQGKHKWKLK